MNKKLFGILNFLLLCAYGVFCWYYSYLKPGYARLNIFIEILKFSGVFLGAAAGSVITDRLGRVIFARFQGLKIFFFRLFFIWIRHDGERLRIGPGRGLKDAPEHVQVRLKDAFDTAPAFAKNRARYSRFLLGGLFLNAAVFLAAAVTYAVCLAGRAVFTSAVTVSVAVMICCWYSIYAAFTEDGRRRGAFLSYQRSRDTECLVIALAAQSAYEELDRMFLIDEAQKALVFRIGSRLPLGGDAEGALSAIALYAGRGKIGLDPVIENYLKDPVNNFA